MRPLLILFAAVTVFLSTGQLCHADAPTVASHPGYLGVLFQSYNELTPPEREQGEVPSNLDGGAVVGKVDATSPAKQAGLLRNDVIVQIDGQRIENAQAASDAITSRAPGDKVTIDVIRNGQPLTLTAVLSKRPKDFDHQQQMGMWGISEKTPTTFDVPASYGAAVMAKAQDLILQWADVDQGMDPMKINNSSALFIRTDSPTEIGQVGFVVTRTSNGDSDEISVVALHYAGNLLFAHSDSKDAAKRAHLLAYLLLRYAATLTPPLSTGSAPPETANSAPTVPDDLESIINQIRTQLAAGQYDTAISTIDSLKSAVADRQKAESLDSTNTQPDSSRWHVTEK